MSNEINKNCWHLTRIVFFFLLIFVERKTKENRANKLKLLLGVDSDAQQMCDELSEIKLLLNAI